MKVDATDLRILRALQNDPEASVEAIGRAAGLSHTPCWRRIRRMQAEGVIGPRRYRINERAVGLGVTVLTMVKLSRQDETALEAFEQAANALAEVIDCYLVTGRYDFVLTVLTHDTESFEALVKGRLSRLPHIAELNSTVVLRKSKSGGALPI